VIFEGVDTSGKSTQIDILKGLFKDAIFTKEPGGTKLGADIRKLLLEGEVSSKTAELFLFLSDRAEHYHRIIKPNKDKLIFSDRGFISGIAYAMTNGKDFDLDTLIELNMMAIESTLPDKLFLFVTNENLIKERLKGKDKDNIENRGIKYLLEVQDNMKKVISLLGIKYVEIDSSMSIDDIGKIIVKEIKNHNGDKA
jgi:dTMP kinase